MSAPAHRDNNFDLIRLLAALQVVVVHGFEHLKLDAAPIQWLQIFPGVPIFFVISGYLISASYERSPSLRSYARNRFLRIYPALWVCLAISIASVELFYGSGFDWAHSPKWLIAQLTIAQFYNPDFLRGYGTGVLNGSLWTIPVELQFYLALPWIYRALARLRWSRTLTACLMLILIGLFLLGRTEPGAAKTAAAKLYEASLLPHLYLFLWGVLLRKYRAVVVPFLTRYFYIAAAAYLALALALASTAVPVFGNGLNPVSALLLGCIVVGAAHTAPSLARRMLRGADLSYGIYIYHMVVINACIATGAVGLVGDLVLAIAVTLIFAALSWSFVEKPALSLKYKIPAPAALYVTR